MRGCSKTRKKYLGGSHYAPLAYNGPTTHSRFNPNMVPNQLLIKGGSNCGLSNQSNIPTNTNALNQTQPNTGPPFNPNGHIYNNASQQFGGCNCGMTGGGKRKGGCGPLCNMGFMVGGVKHRVGCKCSKCKKIGMKGGNAGNSYSNVFVGAPWTPTTTGNENYYENNTYNNDVSRQMVDVGANPPFLKGGNRKQKGCNRKQKGGTLSNFVTQDLINLGRQFQFGIGSAYNALSGYPGPINPLPWMDQFPNKPSINPAII